MCMKKIFFKEIIILNQGRHELKVFCFGMEQFVSRRRQFEGLLSGIWKKKNACLSSNVG